MLDGEACAMTIRPNGAMDRSEDVLGSHRANALEILLQHALLDRHLRARLQMLQLAASTAFIVWAARGHALTARLQDLNDFGEIEAAFASHRFGYDDFTRQ